MIKIDVTRLEIALYFSKMLIALYKTFICIGAHLSPPPGGGRGREVAQESQSPSRAHVLSQNMDVLD